MKETEESQISEGRKRKMSQSEAKEIKETEREIPSKW